MANAIEELVKEVADAKTVYDNASRDASFANSAATSARNRLNAAQKKLDAFVMTMREDAPSDSDWGRAREEKRHDRARQVLTEIAG